MRRFKEIVRCLTDRLVARGYVRQSLEEFREGVRDARESRVPGPIEWEGKTLADAVVKAQTGDRAMWNNAYMMKLHARADWNGTDPILFEFARKYYNALRRLNIPMYVHTAYRSPQLQEKLADMGHSTVRSGPHQRGAALDIVHAHFHWNLDQDFWWFVGEVGERIVRQNNYPIEWGGRFKSLWDPAHWQVKDWRERKPFEASPAMKVEHVPSAAMFMRPPREVDLDPFGGECPWPNPAFPRRPIDAC